jgi:hypothetical protein
MYLSVFSLQEEREKRDVVLLYRLKLLLISLSLSLSDISVTEGTKTNNTNALCVVCGHKTISIPAMKYFLCNINIYRDFVLPFSVSWVASSLRNIEKNNAK